jgi:outer membrane protein
MNGKFQNFKGGKNLKLIKTKIILTAALFFILTGISFASNNAKIGLIDFQKIINDSQAGKKAIATLDENVKKMRDKLQAKGNEIKELEAKLKKESLVMSNEAREASTQDYRIKMNDYKTMNEKFNTDISKLQKTLLNPIQNDIKRIVENFSKKENLNLIIERRAAGVFYALDSIDITDKIIKIYDTEFRLKKK